MAADLLECVPNFSEGRDRTIVDRLAEAATTGGARLLHVTSDPDHHRSVLTLAGSPAELHAGMLVAAQVAIAAIDLRAHRGVHPRVGAVDVVPFVPLGATPWRVAVEAARELGRELAQRFELPILLYEGAASAPHRRALPDARRGGFEGLAAKLATADWRPDFGPARPHPTAGAVIVGARRLLVAWNILIDGALDDARRIAGAVRESSGGLPAVRAIGVWLDRRGLAQVSLNLLDTERTSVLEAFEGVEAEARRRGVEVVESELIGLAPRAALPPGVAERTRLRIDYDPILENALERVGLSM